MSRLPPRDPVRILGWWLRWVVAPAVLGIFVSANVIFRALPLFGPERETAVLFLDGQAYIGHLDDSGETGTLVLRDVYYLQDAKGAPTNLPVGLLRRGGEAHEPADGMRINRDKVFAVERVGLDSGVARAIRAERAILEVAPPAISLNRPAIGTPSELVAQRVAVEQAIARGYAAGVDQLTKLNELVLPVPKTAAQAITQKALEDLHTVRRNALVALGATLRMTAGEAQAYAAATDPRLEGQTFASEPGVLVAPDLNAIVLSAASLYAQVGDAAAKQLTQPTPAASPKPSPSSPPPPVPSPTRSPVPSATPRL